MKRFTCIALASLSLASVSLALPALAHADDAFVTADVNMRAGPDPGYPLIDQIRAGTEVDVQGCTEGYEWCDVIAYDNRGWVAGNYINYEYQDQPVLLPSYGARIGVPIVAFAIGAYWANHYYNRPFYRERNNWYHYRYTRRPPPPPPSRPYRGPIHHWSSPGRPGYPHQPDQRPGHLGPVNPGHAVRANSAARPTRQHENYPQPRPSSHAPAIRPATTGMSHRPGQRPGQLGPVNPGHAMPSRPAAASRPMPATRPAPAPRARPEQRARPAQHQEHRPERKDDKQHDH